MVPLFLIACLLMAAEAPETSPSQLFARLDANHDQQLSRDELQPAHQRLFDRLLRTGDANQDGRLSPTELATALTPSAKPKPIVSEATAEQPAAAALNLLLLRLDTNRDSTLTRGEVPSYLRSDFDELANQVDGNQDGQISYRELVQGFGPARRVAQRAARQHDWQVTEELAAIKRRQGKPAERFEQRPDPRRVLTNPGEAAAIFQQLDANRDGRLERNELPPQAGERADRLFRVADRDRSGDLTQQEFLQTTERLGRLIRRLGASAP